MVIRDLQSREDEGTKTRKDTFGSGRIFDAGLLDEPRRTRRRHYSPASFSGSLPQLLSGITPNDPHSH